MAGRIEIKPIWERCNCCDDFICNLHEVHVYDCACPEIDVWIELTIDPYNYLIPIIIEPFHDGEYS